MLAAALVSGAALLFFAARLAVKASGSVSLAGALAAVGGGIIARVVVDQVLDVGGFALATVLSGRVGAEAGVLAVRGAETAVLLGAGVAIGVVGAGSRGSALLAVAAVAAGISGLFGLPGSGAAAYPASPASLPDWLIVVDALGRHAAWASCLAGAVIGGAASRRAGRRAGG
jgi:hypothetical protein